MATGVGLAQISITQLNSPTPITPSQVQEWGSYLPYKQSYCQFSVKFPNFRCHGNRGCSGANFNSTVKFANPDNPLQGPGMGVVSPIQAELLAIFC